LRQERERCDVLWSYDGEVSSVEADDGGGAESFGDRDD
jgi:hypothetical protein